MTETEAVASPETLAARILPVYAAALAGDDFWEPEIAVRVRHAGALWARAGGRLDALLETVNHLAGDLLDEALHDHRGPRRRCSALRRFSDACGRVAMELLRGFNQAPPGGSTSRPPVTHRDLALALLAGDTQRTDLADVEFAPAYAIVAVRANGSVAAEAVEGAFHRFGGDGTLSLLQGNRGYVLLPVQTEEGALKMCARVAGVLQADEMWAALTWGPSAVVPDARQVVSDVLALVTALRLPPGVYRRQDVLVEYAAIRSPSTARLFQRLIEGVMNSSTLRETLEALIAADGNRTRAAERLVIHRSTIDYRLDRIEQLTGQSPSSVRGLRALTAAYALYVLAEEDRGADYDLGLTGLRSA
ncbi:PucR family transcriptional regulator [Lentzea kentuckyensis]|uniref:PucR family transcriptional regulator n=1 Tax=Lentzea kentuckyensis TaxID=360086 RepID=UPI000A374617|nr:helix-turn-helix domain-containing protein [Lentzea kentuckyensis]